MSPSIQPGSDLDTCHQSNLLLLNNELDWLTLVINQVICSYFEQEGKDKHWLDIPMPDLTEQPGIYAELVKDWQLNRNERLALALTMAPHLRPNMLDLFLGLNSQLNRGFTEFGGAIGKTFGGFLPTGQTLIFLISGNDPQWRGQVMAILDHKHRLMAEQVLSLEPVESSEPSLSGKLYLADQWYII